MRNLKRALSLVLAVVMVLGLMVVGAGAVSYNDFPDRDEIVNKDAVSMLTTLGIIKGTDQGTYDPTGDVDRAQMAKMISVMLTNNENCDTLYQSVNNDLTDITTNWARGYINYCYVRGIIAGRGNNTFDPGANVTGVEAAKMLLTALGYDADIEGLVGPDWALNTAALAQQLGIFRNFTKDVNEPLNRDDAALLIYNALDVELIQEYRNGYAISYLDNRTVLSSVFGVMRVEGVVIGNEWARLDGESSETVLREGRTTLENVVVYDSTTANTVTGVGESYEGTVPFNVSTPVEYLGKAVTLYIEKTTVLSNSKVIGVATNDNLNKVINTSENAEETDDLLKGTGIDVDGNTQYYVNYGHCDSLSDAVKVINEHANLDLGSNKSVKDYFMLNGIPAEIIDNDDDGTAEYVLYTMKTLSLVRSYNTNQETVTLYDYVRNNRGALQNTAESFSVDFEDVVAEDDIATDDLVLYVQYGGRTYVELADIVTGTMNRVDRDEDNELYITLDNGEEYRQSYIPETASKVDADIDHFDVAAARSVPGFDTAYDFILDSEGYVAAIRPAETVVRSYALVLDSAWTQNALTKGGEVKVLTAENIETTYTLDWAACYGTGDFFANEGALEDYLGTRDVNTVGDQAGYATSAAVGTVIAYSLNEAGDRLTIEAVLGYHNDDMLAANDGYVTGTTEHYGDGSKTVPVYAQPNAAAPDAYGVDAANNLQWTLRADYNNKDATLRLNTKTVVDDNNKAFVVDYAIDRNTVAFYYENKDNYGVAVGWNEMGDLDVSEASDGTIDAQVWPVERKTSNNSWECSKLAEVVLFDTVPEITSRDYLLVLSRNAYTASDELWLNVVFEDGTTAEIQIDDNNSGNGDFELPSDFMCAYAYVENEDGTYDLTRNTPIRSYTADLLRVGTVDRNGVYFTLTDDANVWDVTGMKSANDEVQPGSFDYNVEVNAVIVPTVVDGQVIRTAFIWDIDSTTGGGLTAGDFRDMVTNGLYINIYTNKQMTVREVSNYIRQNMTGVKDVTLSIWNRPVGAAADFQKADYYTALVVFTDSTSVTYYVSVIPTDAYLVNGTTIGVASGYPMSEADINVNLYNAVKDASSGASYVRVWDAEARTWKGVRVDADMKSEIDALEAEQIETGYYGIITTSEDDPYAIYRPGEEVIVPAGQTWLYDGKTYTAGQSFRMPATDVYVYGGLNTVTVTGTIGAGATVYVNNQPLTSTNTVSIPTGEPATLTVTVDAAVATLNQVLVNGTDVTAELVDGSYTIPADVTASAVTVVVTTIPVVPPEQQATIEVTGGTIGTDYTVNGGSNASVVFDITAGTTVTIAPVGTNVIEDVTVSPETAGVSVPPADENGVWTITVDDVNEVNAGDTLTAAVSMEAETPQPTVVAHLGAAMSTITNTTENDGSSAPGSSITATFTYENYPAGQTPTEDEKIQAIITAVEADDPDYTFTGKVFTASTNTYVEFSKPRNSYQNYYAYISFVTAGTDVSTQITLPADATTADLTEALNTTGVNTVIVAGDMTVDNLNLSSVQASTLSVASGATLTLTDSTNLGSKKITGAGNVTVQGALSGTGAINVTGAVELVPTTADAAIATAVTGGSVLVGDNADLRANVTATNGDVVIDGAEISTNAVTATASGNVVLRGAVALDESLTADSGTNGSVTVDTGAVVTIGSSKTLSTSSDDLVINGTVGGDGTVEVTSADIEINGAVNCEVSTKTGGDITINEGATIGADVRAVETLTINAANLNAGSNTLTGDTIVVENGVADGELVFNGTTGKLTLNGGEIASRVTIDVAALKTIEVNGGKLTPAVDSSSGTLTTVTLNGGEIASKITTDSDAASTVNLNAGTVGAVEVAESGSVINLGKANGTGLTLKGALTSGSGTVAYVGGPLTIDGTVTLPSAIYGEITVAGGALTLTANTTLNGDITVDAGKLAMPATGTVTIANGVTVNVADGATLDISSAAVNGPAAQGMTATISLAEGATISGTLTAFINDLGTTMTTGAVDEQTTFNWTLGVTNQWVQAQA